MKDFELFDSEFKMIRADQKFLSEREAAFLYAKKLPSFLLEKVEKERLRHTGQDFLFLRGLPGMTPPDVRHFVNGILGQAPTIVKALDDGFLVGVRTKEDAEKLLARDRQSLSTGCTFSVERTEFLLTVEEIAALVKQTLEPRESAEEIKRNFAQQKSHQRARVNEVEAELEGESTPPGTGVAVVSTDKKFKGKAHPKKQDAATNCDPGEGSAPPSSQNLSNANATAGSNSSDPPPQQNWSGGRGGQSWQGGKGKSGGGKGKGGFGGRGKGDWHDNSWSEGKGKGKGKGSQC
jgi:uncharacterized membrane protein YgcG